VSSVIFYHRCRSLAEIFHLKRTHEIAVRLIFSSGQIPIGIVLAVPLRFEPVRADCEFV
jgi:hypothetical protein